ncbi:hypothetical protein PC129_g18413 [Phytophthora cactorum]|uniref:Uncharacterized protein n=1 Tax=Phytophthora cactorum TaxID=29920 RepID=A0A329SEA8_9STRA|nr:hypothetical protein Pcac1_g10135 [Phytophthora cactorum]KAG2809211.1 hypothetical protein PC111_g16148 [Phytophthora cactorum]KAG2849698.1 hypothetical protein PC113_g17328 [Phytophthora cactorum]KAG2887167.1 hypothetical protein PC114_g18924 [Phytophthora cactorum]KAG2898836.1 hypothetical protein PC115_g16737 [Phytophthora cactorum]
MVSRFETPNVSFGHFDRSSAKLSDSVIGHVLRRGRPRHTIRDEILQTPPETSMSAVQHTTASPGRIFSRGGSATVGSLSPGETSISRTVRPMSGSSQNATSFLSQARKTMQVSADHVRLSGLKRLRDVEEMDKFDGLEIKKAIRREQCRHNQARYRDRQRAFQRRAQHEV